MGYEPEEFPTRFGPFLLLRLLGSGGMGSAYLARHAQWDGYLVVKRLHQHFMEDKTVFKRFIHEAKVATYVRHPNVTPLVAMGTVGKEPFFATDFVFGIAFSQLLDRIEDKMSAALPYELILRIAIGASKGIEAIHQAVDVQTGRSLELIHRDIGSRNILLGFDGRPRVIDLGLGKSVFADWQTAAGIFAGSPDYMPPEQALGHAVDRRGDVYSLAVTIWELIVGRKRIREDTVAKRIARAVEAEPEAVRRFRPEVSIQMEEALQKCMDPSPENRFPQVSLLVQVMERELARLNKAVRREDVVKWLDIACATVLAKERRVMRQLDEQSHDFNATESDLRETEYLVAQPIIFMPQSTQVEESEIGSPSQWIRLLATAETKYGLFRRWWLRSSKLSRWALISIVVTIFTLLLMISVSRQNGGDQSNVTRIDGIDVAQPRQIKVKAPVRSGSDTKQKSPTKPRVIGTRSGRRVNTRPRVDKAGDQRKAGFVARIRTLRRQRFDVRWQKRLTELSGRISNTVTSQGFDRIEEQIRGMEQEVR
jgi:serine/threonine protein kinase